MQAVEELFGVFHAVPLAEPHPAPYPVGLSPGPSCPRPRVGEGPSGGAFPPPEQQPACPAP